ncbi:hypothetical protein EX30DRAFT_348016 [Ascodesmis nigricans]|uniref:Uncharacterized protein n=1 Tax=Ascodesmis nigricans TaxID=341454 RepID=A0A4V3SJ01_9PEZI|nr:hypothetical protein EX30DRAFT_348016 [Ascodesmis nigricans]
MSTTAHHRPTFDRRLSSPPCAHLPHTPIAPAMDPDFLALKKKIAQTDHSFTEHWFGPDDIVESLDWDEAIGDGFRRYSYNSKTDTIVVVVPTSLHRAVETWLRNEVERMHSIGFISTEESDEVLLLFGNVLDNFPRPYQQSRKQPAAAVIPYSKHPDPSNHPDILETDEYSSKLTRSETYSYGDHYTTSTRASYSTAVCDSPVPLTSENEHRKPTLVVEIAEIGITATQVRKDIRMWAAAGVGVLVLLVVEWEDTGGRNGGGDGELEGRNQVGSGESENNEEKNIETVDVEVYNFVRDEQGRHGMALVARTPLIGFDREGRSDSSEKVTITRGQFLGDRCEQERERAFGMDLGGLRELAQLAAPHAEASSGIAAG